MPDSSEYPLVALVVLDGWGLAAPGPGNAVELAMTPVFDALRERYPHSQLDASGQAVGLPDGQMGNSEVGHLTIGAGRIIDQDLMRVTRAIRRGDFFENPALVGAFARARERGGCVHLMGLVSYGGVHSHIDHIRALLDLARREGMEDRTIVDGFTDGRDVSPTAAASDFRELVEDGATIGSVAGRYWAMDRDKRWDRTDRALAVITGSPGAGRAADPVAAVEASYAAGVTDEFIEPVVLDAPHLTTDDAAIFFNFRPDRARQLSQRLLEGGFDLTTMTRYRDDLACPVAFAEQNVEQTLAEVVATHGLRQLHIAETEKYAHVTYFLNGGREKEWGGEVRVLVPSPKDVATYDLKPEMSAAEVARHFEEEIRTGGYRFAIVNFANPDMVGHTGVIPAVIRAVEAVDTCLGRVVEAVLGEDGACLVFADHGNAEQLLEPDGISPHTAHTTNPVPLLLVAEGLPVGTRLRPGGGLADIAPTCLGLMGIEPPVSMSGEGLVEYP